MSDNIVFIMLLALPPIPSGSLLYDLSSLVKSQKSNRNWLSLLIFDAGKNIWKQSVVSLKETSVYVGPTHNDLRGDMVAFYHIFLHLNTSWVTIHCFPLVLSH